MDSRARLFRHPAPYDLAGTDALFLEAVRENARFHLAHCPGYASICAGLGASPEELQAPADLARLPVLSTLFLKNHPLASMEGGPLLRATSSGTGGAKTEIAFDWGGLAEGFWMVWRLTGLHHIRSLRPAHYIVLGYQPHRSNGRAVAKTALGTTLLAPALSRTYALRYHADGYALDLEGLLEALERRAQSGAPVRLVGFPAYAWFLLREAERRGLRLRLHPDSKVLLGGGWKQFYRERVEKDEFYAMLERTLGLSDQSCHEFFGAVEHPILYCDCRNHHFHVPIYSRVIIRDPDTLAPLPPGQPGLVNLLSPMVKSMPLTSVMTDDLGVLHEGAECGCGITTPWLELIGRVGPQGFQTCAAGAQQLLGGNGL